MSVGRTPCRRGKTGTPAAAQSCLMEEGKSARFSTPHDLALLRARRERPSRRRAAECGQQFPPSDGDCHTPLPCEVRKWNDTTPRACSLAVQGLVASTSVFGFHCTTPAASS